MSLARLPVLAAAATVFVSAVAAADPIVYPKSKWDAGYYSHATPGDFAVYQNSDGLPTSRDEVVRVDRADRKVTVVETVYTDPVALTSTTASHVRWFVGDEPAPGPHEVHSTNARLRLHDGTVWDCVRRDYVAKEGPQKGRVVQRDWWSPKVPFNGILRREAGGTVAELGRYVYQKAPRN